jgi:hypothetical protein
MCYVFWIHSLEVSVESWLETTAATGLQFQGQPIALQLETWI